MNVDKRLTGGAAVGAGFIAWFTHGGTYGVEEIVAMSAGAGAVVTYLVSLVERVLSWGDAS